MVFEDMMTSSVSSNVMQVHQVAVADAVSRSARQADQVSPQRKPNDALESRDPVSRMVERNEGDASESALEAAVASVNDFIQTVNRDLNFSVDDDTGRKIIKVIDSETDQVIRQIPPEDFLDVAKKLGELQGMLFKDQA